MLEDLDITNLGIIARASIPLGPGFNVITGETGAGKSMVLQSVQLLSGARGSATFVKSGASRCEVVSTFAVSPEWISEFGHELSEKGAIVDDRESLPPSLIISRELTDQGRSKAFLGGRSIPIGGIAPITQSLIAVHGQAEQIRLREPQEQLALIDRAGGSERVQQVSDYRAARKKWRALIKTRNSLIADRSENALKAQVLSAGVQEIAEVAPKLNEDIELQDTLNVLRSSEAIRALIESARDSLTERESGAPTISKQLQGVAREIAQATEHDQSVKTFADRVNAILSEIIDIDAELADYLRALDADPIRLDFMEQRLASIKSLMKKYGPTITDIHEWSSAAQVQLPELEVTDEFLSQLDADIADSLEELVRLGNRLTVARRESASDLSHRIESELKQLAMPRAKIDIHVKSNPDPAQWTTSGADQIEFTIAVDGGNDFRPMGSSVSGGELSRLMLAIEVALASENSIPTMIFDEVDSGIGGEVAVEVGRRLALLAQSVQVIVVTHLPQVAAFAHTHFVVRKSTDSSETTTTVTEVKGEDRTREITRMLSGLTDSTSGAAHAEELLAMARR